MTELLMGVCLFWVITSVYLYHRLQQLERRRVQSQWTLEQQVEERTHELRTANATLQQKIVEKSQVKQELEQERNLLRTLLNSLPDYIYVKDTESRFVLTNASSAHALGAAGPEYFIGKTDFDIFAKEYAERYYADEQRVLRTREPLLNKEEFNPEPHTGTPRWFVTTKVPLYDQQGEEVVGLVGISHDITEKKTMMETFHQKAMMLDKRVRELDCLYGVSQIIEHAEDDFPAAFMATARFIPRAWKDADNIWVRIHVHDQEFVSDHVQDTPWKHETPIMVFEQTSGMMEVGYIRPPQHTPADNFSDEKRKMLSAITTRLGRFLERQQTKHELAQYHAHLEELVAERTAELKKANEQLQLEVQEREYVENALSAERNLLHAVIDAIPDDIFVKNEEGRFILANRTLARFFGVESPEDIIGKTDGDFFPQKMAAQFETEEQMIVQSGQKMVDREGLFISQETGMPRWVLTAKVPLCNADEQIIGIVGVNRDITERKQAEQAFIEEHNLLRTLIDNVPDHIYVKDPQSRFMLVNKAFAQFVRASSPDDLMGKSDFDLYPPEFAEQLDAVERIILSTGKPMLNREVLYTDPVTGEDVWLLTSKLPFLDSQGKLAGLIGIKHNITQRKQDEDALRQFNVELEHRVAERTRTLQHTLEDLQNTQDQLVQSAKMAALGQLVAGVAHEINTPLGAINASVENISYALNASLEALAELLPQLSPHDQTQLFELVEYALCHKQSFSSREERRLRRALRQELETFQLEDTQQTADTLIDIGVYQDIQPFLSLLQGEQQALALKAVYNLVQPRHNIPVILTAVKRMTRIVFALKSYAHHEYTSQKQLADVTEGIDVVLTLYHNQLKHGIDVSKTYEDVPAILCYPDELNQVWTNIIHNAIQAMKGRGRLVIEVCKHPPAPIEGGRGVSVSFTNSGPPIPEDIRERIFEPFFTTKSSGEGSGLGLDICKKIIDKHEGTIDVISQPESTRFRVWLPILED